MIDFSTPPELESRRQSVAAFMDQYVYPNEQNLVEDEGLPVELESDLQRKVKAQGLWAPNLPREWGGMGIGFIGQALMNEVIGQICDRPTHFWLGRSRRGERRTPNHLGNPGTEGRVPATTCCRRRSVMFCDD